MKKGFAIVELAIVLVIIGLVAGGILVGKDMLRSAELNSIVVSIEEFNTATQQFKQKYDSIPGDMPNAQDFWSECIDNGLNTCNGNGDGRIGGVLMEGRRFWQHITLSGLAKGNYQGNQTGGAAMSNDDFPFILQAPLFVRWLDNYQDKTNSTLEVNKHFFSQPWDSQNNLGEEDMAMLDRKYDDGKPESGNIRVEVGDDATSGCLTNTSPADYDYTFSGDYVECYSIFLMKVE